MTSNGNIVQSQVSSEVQRALYQNKNVDVLSGVHGFPNGTMQKELQFFADDVAKFGDLPGVTVHNINNMTKSQIQNVMKKDSTVIGAFCNSGACLKPLE